MAKTVSFRLTNEEIEWLDEQVKINSTSKVDVLRLMFKAYKERNTSVVSEAANVVIAGTDFSESHRLIKRITSKGLEVKDDDGKTVWKINTPNDLLDFCEKRVFKWK